MEQVRLYLTRHGETLENRRHVLQGQLPGTLSDTGLRQSEELAQRMEGVALDAVVASDLARSVRTAEVVARRKGLAVDVTPLLREMDWGVYTGQALVDVDWTHLPESVEQVEALYRRAGEFLAYIKEKYAGRRVLAVGHGAFNRAVMCRYEGREPFDMVGMPIMENTAVAELVY